jgi:hypothetical protein
MNSAIIFIFSSSFLEKTIIILFAYGVFVSQCGMWFLYFNLKLEKSIVAHVK